MLSVGQAICGGCARGLPCKLCNTALGSFKDDPKRIARAIAYLERAGHERSDRE
ncbi:endonuclease domain-containing protein [Streptomyces griseofuscus]|uniref:endonuclease domain-containing protein n=1 Tax=Streptomyces griseofuscus TaxID=146922 RepID=UPI0037FD0094